MLTDGHMSTESRIAALARLARDLARLFEVNSARIKNDFLDRVAESRRRLEHELREYLRALVTSAERTLEQVRSAHAEAAAAVEAALIAAERCRAAVLALRQREA
jgi:hypothetical protein